MKKIVFACIFLVSICFANESIILSKPGFGHFDYTYRNANKNLITQDVKDSIKENIKSIKNNRIFYKSTTDIKLQWLLKTEDSFSDFGYYGISNFVV